MFLFVSTNRPVLRARRDELVAFIRTEKLKVTQDVVKLKGWREELLEIKRVLVRERT